MRQQRLSRRHREVGRAHGERAQKQQRLKRDTARRGEHEAAQPPCRSPSSRAAPRTRSCPRRASPSRTRSPPGPRRQRRRTPRPALTSRRRRTDAPAHICETLAQPRPPRLGLGLDARDDCAANRASSAASKNEAALSSSAVSTPKPGDDESADQRAQRPGRREADVESALPSRSWPAGSSTAAVAARVNARPGKRQRAVERGQHDDRRRAGSRRRARQARRTSRPLRRRSRGSPILGAGDLDSSDDALGEHAPAGTACRGTGPPWRAGCRSRRRRAPPARSRRASCRAR